MFENYVPVLVRFCLLCDLDILPCGVNIIATTGWTSLNFIVAFPEVVLKLFQYLHKPEKYLMQTQQSSLQIKFQHISHANSFHTS